MAETRFLPFHSVDFEIPAGVGDTPFFVLGIRKSGSSIFNNICTAVAKFNGVPYVDVGGRLFDAGISERRWLDDEALARIVVDGCLYGGFRSYPTGLARTPEYRRARKVCLVRDPRDALVSEYFSNAYSHSMPESGEAADNLSEERQRALSSDLVDYVRTRIDHMDSTCAPFVPLRDDATVKVFRYEDVIFDKPRLMREVCDHFGWSISDQQIGLIMQWADVRPAAENPNQFVRRVTPGDYLNKMPETLQDEVAERLRPFMQAFDYN